MRARWTLGGAAVLLTGAIGSARAADSAPRTLVVAADGSGGFTTVQAAVDAVPTGNRERVIIRIRPGSYKGLVHVPREKPFLTFRGDAPEAAAHTLLTYDRYAMQLGPDGRPYGTGRTPSVTVDADDFTAEDITFENSAGHGREIGQALALTINGDRAVFRRCRFLGWQDTLYASGLKSRQYFQECEIEGSVDFIFGYSSAVFEKCRIRSRAPGYVTAHARLAPEATTGYVFRDCTLSAAADVPDGSVYLGRPWRPYARVVFINCALGAHIRRQGWDNWRDAKNESTAWFAEYHSSGAGATPEARVPWSRQLTGEEAKPFETRRFLAGEDGWDPQRKRDDGA